MNTNHPSLILGIFIMSISPYLLSGSTTNAVSNIKPEETVRFFSTAAWLDEQSQTWHIPIHAWVYEPEDSRIRLNIIASVLDAKYVLKVTDSNKNNFDRRINLLIADNERSKQLIISLAGNSYRLKKTNAKGQSFTLLEVPASQLKESGDVVKFQVSLAKTDPRSFSGIAYLLNPRGLSILSDIDDTVKISEVNDHGKLFDNTFYQDFRPVQGMVNLYRELSAVNASLHFVSSSPWQLYPVLDEFFDSVGFPQRTISLKTVRFRDSSFFNLFKKGDRTKPKQIGPLLDSFPERKFILIGDSGEQDATVYRKIIEDKGNQIIAAFIRRLDSEQTDTLETDEKLFYFREPDEIRTILQDMAILKQPGIL